jgi:glycosyltransferase involved in cell wall biosynthesis
LEVKVLTEAAFIDCLAGSGREGGADIATLELARHLEEAGVGVTLYSYCAGIDLALPRVLKYTPLLREVLAYPLAGRKAMRDAERSCDVIHINSLALAPLYRPDRPVVATLHGIQAQKFASRFREKRYPLVYNPVTRLPFARIEKRAAGNIDHFMVVNRGMRDYLTAEFDVPPDRINVVPNGVDTKTFHPAPVRMRRAVFVGRATRPKGFDTLLDAAPGIEAPILAVVSKIGRSTASLARSRGVEIARGLNRLEVAGAVAASSLLVLPSWDEEQPLVVLEAMACGLPVVTTPAGASDLIMDGENGLIVPPDDPAALSGAVNRLLDDVGLAGAMGERNRAVAEEMYAWPLIAREVREVYLRAGSGRLR